MSPVLAGRATREAQSNDAPIFKKLIIQNNKKKEEKSEKVSWKRGGKTWGTGSRATCRQKGRRTAMMDVMARCEPERLIKQVRPSPALYHLHGLGEPFKAMKNESKTDGGNCAFRLFTHK